MAEKSTKKDRGVDLNDKKLSDYGDQTPFLPFGQSKITARLTAMVFHKGFRGKAYRAKFEVLKSDRDDIKVGYTYCIQFKLSDDQLQTEIKMKALRSFVAAAFSADPRDEDYDANEGIDTLLELTEADALAGEDIQVEIVSVDKQQVDKTTKEGRKNKDGSPKMVTNQFYNPVEKAA